MAVMLPNMDAYIKAMDKTINKINRLKIKVGNR